MHGQETGPRKGPATRDAERTRRALLDAAATEFGERGYAATTARRIADRAGVNQTLVFRYFGSKRNLYQRVLSERSQEHEHQPGEQVLLAALRRFVQPAAANEVHPVMAMLRSVSSAAGAEAMREHMRTTYLPAVQALIAESHPQWSPQQCAVRAELVWAWVLGIGVVRSVIALPAVSELDADALESMVLEVLSRLLDDEAGG